MDGEPFDERKTKALLRSILDAGTVWFSSHARIEMERDGLTQADALHVLRAGRMTEPAEFEKGAWRYRLRTRQALFVTAFRSSTECVIVTAWRLK